jgi:DNA-binding response OmpR family regulator
MEPSEMISPMKNGADIFPSALLIEEDFIHGSLLKAALATCRINVRMAVTEAEASDVLSVFCPDLILADWDVCGIDGRSFIAAMRKQFSALANVPVILMTSRNVEESSLLTLANHGFGWVLSKPVSMPELEHAVQEAISARPMVQSPEISPAQSVVPLAE